MTRRVFLNPGELHFGHGKLRLETLLGSCIAVTLRHRSEAVGGMCHFMLPTRPGKPRPQHQSLPPKALDPRYGDEALLLMMQHMASSDIAIGECIASVYGGANVLTTPPPPRRATVGENNIRFVLDRLDAFGFATDVVDVAGEGYRFLSFDLQRGTVQVKSGQRPCTKPTATTE